MRAGGHAAAAELADAPQLSHGTTSDAWVWRCVAPGDPERYVASAVVMIEPLRGRVESGENDACKWLSLYNAEYSQKLGMPIFPGSLNLRLARPFDWLAPRYQANIIRFGLEEYGGERNILLLPCLLVNLGRRRAFLWTAIHPTLGVGTADIVEILSDVKLRDAYGLTDGALVEVELDLSCTGAGQS